ncbi:hypothetical protein O6H91_02G143300 [Diphasiastrum complanatum]|nr:hypothetical protein O6H91_02G143300 [Diphasiastrum complanatum]
MGLSVVTGRDSALSSDLCPCSTSSSCFMSLDLMGLTGLDAKTGIKTLLIAPTNAGNEEQVIKGSANSDDSDHLLSSEDLIRSLCTDSGMKGIPELDNITRTNDRTTCRYKEILSYSAVENEDGVQAFFQVAEEVSKDCSVYLTVKNTDKYSLPTTLFTNKSTSTVASGENFGGKLDASDEVDRKNTLLSTTENGQLQVETKNTGHINMDLNLEPNAGGKNRKDYGLPTISTSEFFQDTEVPSFDTKLCKENKKGKLAKPIQILCNALHIRMKSVVLKLLRRR